MSEPREPGELVVPGSLESPHLADSSVWSKVRTRSRPDLADWFNAEVRSGRIMTCDIIVLELLRSAQDARTFAEHADQLDQMPACPVGTPQFRRARAVQRLLADRGHQRGVAPTDLLIAASAEAAAVPVLHYDRDYDLIAEVTDQASRWLLPRGTLT